MLPSVEVDSSINGCNITTNETQIGDSLFNSRCIEGDSFWLIERAKDGLKFDVIAISISRLDRVKPVQRVAQVEQVRAVGWLTVKFSRGFDVTVGIGRDCNRFI